MMRNLDALQARRFAPGDLRYSIPSRVAFIAKMVPVGIVLKREDLQMQRFHLQPIRFHREPHQNGQKAGPEWQIIS